ncbi:MAG: cyclic nucleotide-binding domain-containing protein [Desulfovibrionaceae bacterium]|nr:cyclic nucleotide-binding domain-containing protein [Desulfovibrionaceae bacterium]MDD4953140.1 cyclic nucleotide-binding domain-containing protein [Desulfovibrionaceae bacterium]
MDSVVWSQIPLFKDFPAEWLDKVKPLFEKTSRKAGETLVSEGEQGDEMYILVRGRVRVTKSMVLKDMELPLLDLEHPRKVLATLDETSYPVFGEIALIDRDTRSATITVLEDSEFLVTHRDRFFDLLDREPVLGCRLLMVLGQRLAATIRKGNAELIKFSTALALALSRVR